LSKEGGLLGGEDVVGEESPKRKVEEITGGGEAGGEEAKKQCVKGEGN